METINEVARETPIIHQTEVLVVGSGPGGLAAAIALVQCQNGKSSQLTQDIMVNMF